MAGSPESPVPFHALAPEEALARLDVGANGLDSTEARTRLGHFGRNVLPQPRHRGPLRRFLAQFDNVVIYVLIAAGVITGAIGHWLDCGVIFGVVIVNAIIGFIQEGRAEEAIAAVRRMLSLRAAVLRDGRQVEISAEELVPGDVILLQSGDCVAADARLLDARELQADESMLTGESEPSAKSSAPVAASAPPGDRVCIVYSGTMITRGRGRAVVTATGNRTEIGRIGALLAGIQSLTTPLLRQLATFGRWLTAVILGLAAATFLFGVYFRSIAPGDMFLVAVGLSVSAIPEALPAIITIALAAGVRRMAARNAIIRRLPAVEALGSVTVICSDKTGTLTRNEMTAQSISLPVAGPLTVTGTGYGPDGEFLHGGSLIEPDTLPALLELCRAGVLCSDAVLHPVDDGWEARGDPTEAALLSLALKAGLDPGGLRTEWRRVDAIPFESEHRLMAVQVRGPDGEQWVFVKGAPEVVLELCERQRARGTDEPVDAPRWRGEAERLASGGQRTLAIAARAGGGGELTLSGLRGMTFLGLVAIRDPLREEAVAAVASCRSAGIDVKMVTGDHAGTAIEIARQAGIGTGSAWRNGADLDRMDDEELAAQAGDIPVFARTVPEHKLRIVKALQSRGHIVAMTGDGVNDAPALKRADIGVAMGIKGTEVAKEAAEIVLADDNFASIVHAVEEGRTVHDNIRKAILYILPTNGGESFTILLAIIFGMVLPITPAQILWINMVTEITLSVALAFEPPEAGVMRRAPLLRGRPILSGFMAWRILFVTVLMVAGAFGLFLLETRAGADVETARTVALNTLVIMQAAYLVNMRLLDAPALSRAGLVGNRFVWMGILAVFALQLLITYAPFMQSLFHTRAIGADSWERILGAGLCLFLMVEFEKLLLGSFRGRKAAAGGH
jgi:magnesium-transporting ATPase (P-type)